MKTTATVTDRDAARPAPPRRRAVPEADVIAVLAATLRDPLGAGALRERLITELLAQCARCADIFTVDVFATRRGPRMRHVRLTKDRRGRPRHEPCGGKVRMYGPVPPEAAGATLLDRPDPSRSI